MVRLMLAAELEGGRAVAQGGGGQLLDMLPPTAQT